MRTSVIPWLLAVLSLAVQPLIGHVAADEAADLFADAPNVLRPSELERLEFRVRFHPKFLQDERKLLRRLDAIAAVSEPERTDLKQQFERHLRRRAKLEKSPLALDLPKTQCRLDEPVYAYFLVKNASDEDLELDMRLDLQLGHEVANSCGVDLECVESTGDKLPSVIRRQVWECPGPPRLILPPRGYYCTRADLRRIGATVPGVYRIRWGYTGLTSQEVEFTLLPAEQDKPAEMPIRAVHLFKIRADSNARGGDQKRSDEPPPPVIHDARLSDLPYTCFAAGLSVAAADRLYPDLLDLPSQDAFIAASLRFEEPPEGELPKAFVLTLTPRQENRGLYLPRLETLVLLATTRAEGQIAEAADRPEQDSRRMSMWHRYSLADPARPLEIRIELPDDWQRRIGLAGPVELQLIFSTAKVKLQGGWPGMRVIRQQTVAAGTEPWDGLLCTPAVQLEIPAASR